MNWMIGVAAPPIVLFVVSMIERFRRRHSLRELRADDLGSIAATEGVPAGRPWSDVCRSTRATGALRLSGWQAGALDNKIVVTVSMQTSVPHYHVRPVRLRDASEVAAIHVRSSRKVYANILPAHFLDAMTVEERKRRWIEIWTQAGPDQTTLVAEQGQVLVGFGHCGPQRSRSLPYAGEFYSVYVQPEAQRQGVGRALMQAMAFFLLSRGIAAASLWVARDNAGACRFYEAIGGRTVAERTEEHTGAAIAEIAYGWDNLTRLAKGMESPPAGTAFRPTT
jgi:ribosomal protein S18 acetylase RimI-like enzyme